MLRQERGSDSRSAEPRPLSDDGTNMAPRALFIVVAGLLTTAAFRPPTAPQAQDSADVYRIPVTGVIELGLAPFVERSLREAAAGGADAVILDIDTPGGRVDAAERIADALAESEVPVYAFVNRQAYSAGALIALATDGVYMPPGGVMGAATPVTGAGEKAPEKIVSAMRSRMRALAEARGLDPRIAEAMVDEEIAIEGVVEAGKLLTLTAEEARALGYAEMVEDWDGMMATLALEDATVREMQVNWAERIVRFLSHPVVSPFLLTLGFLGLLAEIKTPTFGMAGAAGILALALFFGSHLILGLAGWEDLILFGTGVVLLGVEILFVPGFGVLGGLGILAMIGGLFLSLLGAFPTGGDLLRAGGVLSTTVLLILITAWALLRYLPKSERLARRGIFLAADTGTDVGYSSAVRREELVGAEGVAMTDLRPSGVGLFGEERVDVVSESSWIEQGTPIRILAAEGYRHLVRPIAPASGTETTSKGE